MGAACSGGDKNNKLAGDENLGKFTTVEEAQEDDTLNQSTLLNNIHSKSLVGFAGGLKSGVASKSQILAKHASENQVETIDLSQFDKEVVEIYNELLYTWKGKIQEYSLVCVKNYESKIEHGDHEFDVIYNGYFSTET